MSLVRKAYHAYSEGNYGLALRLFSNAAKLMSYESFEYNIDRCVSRLISAGKNPDRILPFFSRLKLVSILDEISDLSWKTEFELFPVSRKNYKNQIKESRSKALFLESCWKGNGGAWEFAFTSPGLRHANAQALCNAIDIAKGRSLPVVFWNKEDPMHYDRFLPIAKRCDIIFTTDANKVEEYKRDVPDAKVDVLPFAANPGLCNPAGRFKRKPETICFAGSYYSEGHESRKEQMDSLLPTIIKFQGVIYDRMSKLENDRYAYPDQYAPYIRDSVPFAEIVNVYKSFKLFLNVNTITDSPTMMSRRVYELLACGTPVISTPSRAIEEQFGKIVQIARDADEANRIAERLLGDEWEWLRLSHLGYREVLQKHTYALRAEQIKASLGCGHERVAPLVSIIMASNRPHLVDRIVKNISRQRHEKIELCIVIQSYTDEEERELREKVARHAGSLVSFKLIRDDSETPLGARLNTAVDATAGDFVAKMDDDDFYYENYLSDMLLPFQFGNYGLIGKREVFVYLEGSNETWMRFEGERHKTTSFVAGPTFVMRREIFERTRFANVNRGEDSSLLDSIKQNGWEIYAADPFNFAQFRSRNSKDHTWQVEDSFFSSKGTCLGNGLMENLIQI